MDAKTGLNNVLRKLLHGVLTALVLSLTSMPAHAGVWEDSEIHSILEEALSVRDRANAIASRTDGVGDVVGVARDAYGSLDDGLLDEVESAREAAVGRIASELADAREFVGDDCNYPSPCFMFRRDLLVLIDDLSGLLTELLTIEEAGGNLQLSLELSRAKKLVEAAPGLVLYPAYRASIAAGDIFGGGILDVTAAAREHVALAGALLATASPLGSTSTARVQQAGLPADFDACDYVLQVPNVTRAVSFTLLSTAISLKVVGKVLAALGETLVLGGPKEAGVHGYIKLEFHDNKKKKFGVIVDAVASMIDKARKAVDNKLIYCTALGNRVEIMASLESTTHPANRVSRPGGRDGRADSVPDPFGEGVDSGDASVSGDAGTRSDSVPVNGATNAGSGSTSAGEGAGSDPGAAVSGGSGSLGGIALAFLALAGLAARRPRFAGRPARRRCRHGPV